MRHCRVLIADDSADIRLLLRLAIEGDAELELIGEAVDGAEAVSLAQALQPDVLLLDLSMPVMDGLEAIPLVRGVAPTTAIIVVSGFLTGETKQKVLGAGAVGFVEKGGDFGELIAYVKEVGIERFGS
ncbi:MAG: response regulator [Acidimicrobiales bacterium]